MCIIYTHVRLLNHCYIYMYRIELQPHTYLFFRLCGNMSNAWTLKQDTVYNTKHFFKHHASWQKRREWCQCALPSWNISILLIMNYHQLFQQKQTTIAITETNKSKPENTSNEKKKKKQSLWTINIPFFCSNLLSCFPFFIIRIPSHILSPIECSRQNQVSQVFRVERGVQRRHLWNDPGPGRFSTTNFFSFPTHLDVLKPKSAERFPH